MIRVQIVGEFVLGESGLRCLLEPEHGFELVEHSGCGEQCHQICIEEEPDVLILEIGSKCSLDCISDILAMRPKTHVLVLTDHQDNLQFRQAIKAGARGYASMDISSELLAQAVREVAADRRFVEPGFAQEIALDQALGNHNPFDALTQREREIMILLVEGKSTGEIAKTVYLSRNTVANYHTRILQKLAVTNNVELTHLAIRHGIVEA